MLNALNNRRESGELEHSSSVQKNQKTAKLQNEEEDDDAIQFQELPEELCCPIHLGYLRNAVVSKCGHSFCKECIFRTLETKAQCPIDRKPLQKSDLFPNLIIANLIDELLMFCKNKAPVHGSDCNRTSSTSDQTGPSCSPKEAASMTKEKSAQAREESTSSSQEEGCTHVFKFKNRQAHYRECEHSVVVCEWCSTHSCKRKELSQHKQNCTARPATCTLCSKADIPHCELKRHTKWFCPQSTIVCKKCNAKHLRRASKEHLQEHCPFGEMICAALDHSSNEFCNVKYLRKDFEEHQKVCQFLPAKCTNAGCHIVVARRHAAKHDMQCGMKVVTCPNKDCGLEFPRQNLVAHRAVCKWELLNCAFFQAGCKPKIPRFQMDEHMRDKASEHMLLMCGTLSAVKQENEKLRKLVQRQKVTFKRKLSQMRGINKRVHRIESTLEELAGTPLDPFAHHYEDEDFDAVSDDEDADIVEEEEGDDEASYYDMLLAEAESQEADILEHRHSSKSCTSFSSWIKAARDVRDPQFLELVAFEQKKTSSDIATYYQHSGSTSSSSSSNNNNNRRNNQSRNNASINTNGNRSSLLDEVESWEENYLNYAVTSLLNSNGSSSSSNNNAYRYFQTPRQYHSTFGDRRR